MIKFKFDGYSFGDRILEGVYFIGEVDDKGKVIKVSIHPDSAGEYWDGLNKAQWLKEAKEHCESLVDEAKSVDPTISVEENIKEGIACGDLEAA